MEAGPTKTWRSDTYASIDPSRPSLSLAGKTIAITGGGAGIGLAIALSCAKAGASQIALIGRRAHVLDQGKTEVAAIAPNAQVLCVQADVSIAKDIQNAFSTIQNAFGLVDILINNAAYFSGASSILDVSTEAWFSAFDVNVKGSLLTAKAFLAVASPNPAIANISTAVAHLPPVYFPGFSAYASSKIAATQMFAYLQHERPDVHIVSIHPGRILTEMSAKVGRVAGKVDVIDTPELPADFTVWTLSEEARFLKGKLIWANWDVEELKAQKDVIEKSNLLTIAIEGWPFGEPVGRF
ncbi:hypothetical protein QQS21_009845 [Conoideocrella luteorostrata]|uniref:NAD(P)-binding protein n=1 Tax=Conoideocrella luteorostrata TaxID=1105319 RepID=A0AAJ0FPZ1_9HYPO|nr:hypothetical protein QQS21_009845 [Conoideocrella luteorostrata]